MDCVVPGAAKSEHGTEVRRSEGTNPCLTLSILCLLLCGHIWLDDANKEVGPLHGHFMHRYYAHFLFYCIDVICSYVSKLLNLGEQIAVHVDEDSKEVEVESMEPLEPIFGGIFYP